MSHGIEGCEREVIWERYLSCPSSTYSFSSCPSEQEMAVCINVWRGTVETQFILSGTWTRCSVLMNRSFVKWWNLKFGPGVPWKKLWVRVERRVYSGFRRWGLGSSWWANCKSSRRLWDLNRRSTHRVDFMRSCYRTSLWQRIHARAVVHRYKDHKEEVRGRTLEDEVDILWVLYISASVHL